ncbi:MAG: tetratricopeptide repeat protein [Hyphomonas sp.]
MTFWTPKSAITAYTEALKLNADYVPALFNLGNTYEDLGDREAAIAQYERALALAPQETEPLARIANLSRPSAREDSIVKRVEGALKRADLTPAARAGLEFALGHLMDCVGAYDEAFSAYARANRLSEAAGAGVSRFRCRAA